MPFGPHYVIPLVFSTLGGGIALFGSTFLRKDRAIRRWPRAPGQIVSSEVSSFEAQSPDPDRPNRLQYSTYYRPAVRFTYTVGERTFESTQVARTVWSNISRDPAQACVDRYPAGARAEVLYDPADPGTAYLETRTSGGAVFLLIFGGFFLFVGVLLTVIFLLAG